MIRSLVTVLLVLITDQALKIYIKLNFELLDRVTLIKDVFELHFIENPGMAFGWQIPVEQGKIILTLFRICAVVVIVIYLRRVVRDEMHKGFITCVSMILAGAIGNIIDSVFYGQLFTESHTNEIAKWASGGGLQSYAGFWQGKVVDMLHICLEWPSWMPYFGERGGEIFPPIFNIADAAISIGVIWIMIRQRAYFRSGKSQVQNQTVEIESSDVVSESE